MADQQQKDATPPAKGSAGMIKKPLSVLKATPPSLRILHDGTPIVHDTSQWDRILKAAPASLARLDISGMPSLPANSTPEQRIRYAAAFYQSAEGGGFKPHQMKGQLATLMGENDTFDATRKQKGGPAFGICMWEAPRRALFGALTGYDMTTLTTNPSMSPEDAFKYQLKFSALEHKMNRAFRESMAGASDHSAALGVAVSFLAPRDQIAALIKRGEENISIIETVLEGKTIKQAIAIQSKKQNAGQPSVQATNAPAPQP